MGTPVTAGFWLSPQQKNAWALQQRGQGLRSACLVYFDREIAVQDLASALKQIVTRHESLRTIYVQQPGMKFPFQVVLDAAEPLLQELDLSKLSSAQQVQELDELFRNAQCPSLGPEQAPIVTAILAMLASNRSAVLLSVPAIAADAASLQVVGRELGAILAGMSQNPAEEPLRYVQFAQWQNDLVEGDEDNTIRAKQFWNSLADVPGISVPHEMKSKDGRAEKIVTRALDSGTASQIAALAKQLNATETEVLLAAWQCVLWRLTGQTSFRVGVVFDGREYEELRDAVGLIAKTLPIDARFDGDFRFQDIVEHVHATMARAAEWQEYYVPGTGFGSDTPVCFEHLASKASADSRDAQVAVCNDEYKLKLSVRGNAGPFDCDFHYNTAQVPQASAERIAGYFTKLLNGALTMPDSLVCRLPLLDENEIHQLLVKSNQTLADYPRDECFHELFEAQAATTPGRPALRFGDELLSYRELNERANQLAHYLRATGVGPDSLVGLGVERSAQTIVAVLAILKAGGAYVPLNPDNPKPRLLQQLAGARALLTEQKLLSQMPEFAGNTVCLDRDVSAWADQSKDNPESLTGPENIVYVIYTSGSTGVPKGVAVRHRNLVNYSCFIARRLRLDEFPEGLNFATVSTLGADLGNTCIFPALSSGGALHVISYEVSTDAQRFAAYSEKHPIDVLKIVPSHLRALLQSPHAKQVLPREFLILGGETLTPKLAEEIFSLGGSCEVFNHYGPTETTIGSLTLRLADYDWRHSRAASIPIGRPIANTQIYILDAHLQPLPTGVIGELYIAGDGVTAGYLHQPEKTAERFVQNPFSSDPSARMYRTGDLARLLADGNVEFLGRGDDQVKIRGFRIELGEIESLLTARPGVKQAVVLAREDSRGDKKLVGYVVTEPGQANSADELRAYLKEQLPEVMVPAAIVVMPKIPLNPNGKVDRQALPEPEAAQSRAFLAPNGATEEGVATIWQEVFRRDRIGADENFFDLGGHSLLATQVISRIRERFRVELPIRAMFDYPTISGLAEAVTSAKATPAATVAPIVRVSREAYRGGRS